MVRDKEIYISTDVETDGPIPGEYSMLSIGSVAFSQSGKVLGKFYRKIKPLKGAKKHPDTMGFWEENPEAYKEATKNAQSPTQVMSDYVKWLENLKKKTKKGTYNQVLFLGWPLGFDHLFVYWYMVKFVKRVQKMHPFDMPFAFHRSIDVNTFVMAHIKKPYLDSLGIRKINENWFKGILEGKDHKAIDDAMYQGKVFMRILKENQKKRKSKK